MAFLEAFDTWLHPDVSYEQFKKNVKVANPSIDLKENEECQYTTQNGNRIHFIIWNHHENDGHDIGSRITSIEYGAGNPADTLVDAGQEPFELPDKFLSGTILKSPAEAVVEIRNPFLGTTLKLDMNDRFHPKRTSETGEVEEAGNNHEVWLDFDSKQPEDGDFFHPFKTIAAAANKVADGGTIRIVPGTTSERPSIHKRTRFVAPIGGVKIGVVSRSGQAGGKPQALSESRFGAFGGTADFILSLTKALDAHDWATITRHTVDGETNYFGHGKVTNAFIRRDMEEDSKTYRWTRSKPEPATFKTWTANGLNYDSIELQTEALEVSGKHHHAHCLFIIGYDPGQSHSISSLELKVIK